MFVAACSCPSAKQPNSVSLIHGGASGSFSPPPRDATFSSGLLAETGPPECQQGTKTLDRHITCDSLRDRATLETSAPQCQHVAFQRLNQRQVSPPHPPVRPHFNPSSSLCLLCTTLANLNKQDFSHCWFSRPSNGGSVPPQSNILAVETAAGPAPPAPPYTDLVNTSSLLYKHSQQRSNSFVAEVRMAGVRNAKVTAVFPPFP